MTIELNGAQQRTDLPSGTKIKVILHSNTEIKGVLARPIAVRTLREGLGGYSLGFSDDPQLNINLHRVKSVEVISFPEPRPVDVWPDGTVLYREFGPGDHRAYAKSKGYWSRTGSGQLISWAGLIDPSVPPLRVMVPGGWVSEPTISLDNF